MAAQQTVQTKKSTKKSFFEVSAPLVSTKISLYAGSIEELENKTVNIDLTKSLKGKSLVLKLRIKKNPENPAQLLGEPENLDLAGSYIRKVIRRGTDYVEDSFEADCRDIVARIKPFLITRRRVSRAILKALRNETKEFILAYVKTRTGKEIFSEIITNKIQKQLAARLKKIYPLALCEIRVFEVLKQKEETAKQE